jgi:hypothetical protein
VIGNGNGSESLLHVAGTATSLSISRRTTMPIAIANPVLLARGAVNHEVTSLKAITK